MLVGASVVIAAYLIGSIPVGLLVGKIFFHIDIRRQGSGNLGATNTFRVLGPVPGVVVFALDFAKGALPVLAAVLLSTVSSEPAHSVVLVLTGMAVIAGHNWSIYLGFQGGKGVATGAGVLLVLFPPIWALLVVVFAVTLLVTRYVSVGSIVISALFPVLVVVMYGANVVYVAFSVVASAVVIFKHRSNIGRLMRGTEPKVLSGTPKESSGG